MRILLQDVQIKVLVLVEIVGISILFIPQFSVIPILFSYQLFYILEVGEAKFIPSQSFKIR